MFDAERNKRKVAEAEAVIKQAYAEWERSQKLTMVTHAKTRVPKMERQRS